MKKLGAVIQFELANFLKNKGFIVTIILISVIFIIGLSLPNFVDVSSVVPGVENKKEEKVDEKKVSSDQTPLAIYDKAGFVQDKDILVKYYPDVKWRFVSDEKELDKVVKNKKADAGFIINSEKDFSYVVNYTSLYDQNEDQFTEVLQLLNRYNYAKQNNLDFDKSENIWNVEITNDKKVLGNDSAQNYYYTYVLVFLVYMMIIFYGQMIATNVTSEKSNRAIEVLVTSTSTNNLIFGKVIAGAISSIIQVGVILGSALITYQVNQDAWGGALDFLFKIPASVLVTFAIFGVLGFLFYCFIYGALGALVSKTEDLSKSISSITYIFVIVFMIGMFCLQNSDGTVAIVCSYIPFTSPILMFVRVAMGTVKVYEIIISAIILIVSNIAVGVLGAKVYRMGTLHYGNPMKLKNVLFSMRKQN